MATAVQAHNADDLTSCRAWDPLTSKYTVLPSGWPVSVSDVLCRALAHDPSERPSMAEICAVINEALDQVQLGQVSHATLPTSLSRAMHDLEDVTMADILRARPLHAA